MDFPGRIFISGTDTGIGKTVISAILLSGLKGRYWKPVQSGLEDITDTRWIMEKTGLEKSRFFRETYRLTRPLSPHASALADGVYIDIDKFDIPETGKDETLIIEGAGGVMVPLNETGLMTDLMKRCNAPVILVARSTLGTINHTLLSVNQLKREGLDIFGIIMNGRKDAGNREAIERFGGVPVIAEIEDIGDINPQSLKKSFEKYFGR